MKIRAASPILILGGTSEAHVLACALGGRARVHLVRAERTPRPWPAPPTLGDRADAAVSVVVDASHPFDLDSARLAARLVRDGATGIRLERAPWTPSAGDDWRILKSGRDAGRVLRPGARLFTALGREGLRDLRHLRGVMVFNRRVGGEGGPFPLRHGCHLPSTPPFTEAGETRLLRRLRVDALMVRNSGGPGGWPKLAAARRLGLPVLMVARPVRPDLPRVRSVEAALEMLSCLT